MRVESPVLCVLLAWITGCAAPSVGGGDGVMDAGEVPQVGWTATLETRAHGTSGTAVVVDESTIELRDFVYDGQGIDARLFLQADGAAFSGDYELTESLVGDAFEGDLLTLPIPDQAELENWNLITLWCVPAGASFGDGVFLPPE